MSRISILALLADRKRRQRKAEIIKSYFTFAQDDSPLGARILSAAKRGMVNKSAPNHPCCIYMLLRPAIESIEPMHP